ncbi:tape measure protein [Weissella confusa]|uniref:Tape measure protein n=1 Tax=Weissella confusa TaxID=1583 RepID=A0A923SN36_WEICO|nr:tape measure protein [Weissella confusa]
MYFSGFFQSNNDFLKNMSKSLDGKEVETAFDHVGDSANKAVNTISNAFSKTFKGTKNPVADIANGVADHATSMGKSRDEINKLATDGKLSMDDLSKAIETMSDAKPYALDNYYTTLDGFSNHLEEKYKSLSGKITYGLTKSAEGAKTLSDAFVNLGRATGQSDESLQGIIKKFSQVNASGKITTGSLTKMEKSLPGFNAALDIKSKFTGAMKAGVEYNKEMQSLSVSMDNFTNGDDKLSKALIGNVKALKEESGYATDTLSLLTKKTTGAKIAEATNKIKALNNTEIKPDVSGITSTKAQLKNLNDVLSSTHRRFKSVLMGNIVATGITSTLSTNARVKRLEAEGKTEEANKAQIDGLSSVQSKYTKILEIQKNELEKLGASGDKNSKAYKLQELRVEHRQEQSEVNRSTEAGEATYQKYASQITQAESKLASLNAQTEKAQKYYDYQKSGLAELNDEIKRSNDLTEIGLNTNKAAESLSQLKSAVKDSTNEWKQMESQLKSSGDVLGASEAKYKGLSQSVEAQKDVLQKFKDAMQNLHWSLDEIEESDYAELMEVMNASENDKMQNPDAMMNLYQSLG